MRQIAKAFSCYCCLYTWYFEYKKNHVLCVEIGLFGIWFKMLACLVCCPGQNKCSVVVCM
jgi:hypothetical protein